MRIMIVTMLLPLLALVGIEVFTRTANVDAATPVVAAPQDAGRASCRVDGAGRLRLIDGGGDLVVAEPHQLATAKNGGLTAYAALVPAGLDVFVCSEAGNVLHRTRVPESEVSTAGSIVKVRLLSADRAFVALHVNPSLEFGLLLDLRNGGVRKFDGHGFSVSADGNVAYFQEPPHFTPASDAPNAGVFVNDRRLAEIPRGSGVSLRWNSGRTITASVTAWNGGEEAYELKPF